MTQYRRQRPALRRRAARPASACAPSCAISRCSASRRAATPAIAAPARCISTASRSIPAWCRPSAAKVARSPRSRACPTNGETASDAEGLPRRPGLPVRLLRRRHDHDGGDADRRAEGRPAARAEGQPLPLHRLSLDQRRAARQAATSRRTSPARRSGASLPNPFTDAILTGNARYTMDIAVEGLLHLKVLRSPHAHARIVDDRRSAALAVPGVVAVYTWEDVPKRLFSSALHEDHLVDPDDILLLDNVARFVGQRIAAVVAETEAAAEAGCRALQVDYEILPAVFDPVAGDGARRAAAARQGRSSTPATTSSAPCRARSATSPRASREADAVHEQTYSTTRVQHVHLETHGSIAWKGDDNRWHVRTSSQAPFAAQTEARLHHGHVRPRHPRVHRAGRRRLRRQAGDGLGRSRPVRHDEARAAR